MTLVVASATLRAMPLPIIVLGSFALGVLVLGLIARRVGR